MLDSTILDEESSPSCKNSYALRAMIAEETTKEPKERCSIVRSLMRKVTQVVSKSQIDSSTANGLPLVCLLPSHDMTQIRAPILFVTVVSSGLFIATPIFQGDPD